MIENSLLKKFKSPMGNQNFQTPRRFLNRQFKKPLPHMITGEIRLGYVFNTSMIFGLQKKEMVQHMLLVGRSGSGKTNIIRVLQIELSRIGIPFLSFDLAKIGTRYIKHHIKDLIILRWNRDFFFNPLNPPPGVTLTEWMMVFCEITSEVFDIRTASNLFLIKFLQELYYNCGAGESGHFPTMHDLNLGLQKKGREKIPRNEIGYIQTIRNKIEPICLTLGDTINVHEGIPIQELLKYPVSIELVGIKSSEIQTWVMSLIMAWISCYRETQDMQFGKLKHVFFFDEAAKILGKGES